MSMLAWICGWGCGMGKGEIVCSNDVCHASFFIVVNFICSFKMGVVEGMLPLHFQFCLHSSFYRFLRFVVDRLLLPFHSAPAFGRSIAEGTAICLLPTP